MTDGLTSSNEDEEINNVSYCLLNYVDYIIVVDKMTGRT